MSGGERLDLTEHEAELYDRQIRLWGLESQKRIRSARILICGLNGLGAEVAKNIILSGVKAITLLDHKNVTELDFPSQFFAKHDSVGTNRAEASRLRAQALNPMVELTIDKQNVNEKPDEFFYQFNAVVLIEASTATLVRINNTCRMQGIKFFAGDVWGMNGFSFVDLQEHEFAEDVAKHKVISKPDEKIRTELVTQTVKRTMTFPPLQDVLAFDHTAPHFLRKLKRTGPSYLIMRCLLQFRDQHNRDPLPTSRAMDIETLHSIRDEIGKGLIPDDAFVHVFCQISPVCAIVGGELAQEVIKAVSQKEAPNLNVFLFDPEKCCGFIEPIAVN